jgi:hypothetical protein
MIDGQSVDGGVNHYTRQDRTGLDHMKSLVATTFDPELISVLVQSGLSHTVDNVRTEPDEFLEFPGALSDSQNPTL